MRGCTRAAISPPLIYILFLFMLLTSPTAASYSKLTSPSIFPRQTACPDSVASTSCGIANFCCPVDTRCIPIDHNSSVVCCKIGEFCDEIFPTACTAVASVQCGKQCCPLGYDCGGSKDRCVLKPENLPPDHVANRNSKKTKSDEVMGEQCRAFLAASGHAGARKKCTKFSFEGILTGLFPGIAVGVAIMFAYTKALEMKSRRRTILFNGRLSASPDDLSYINQEPPPLLPAIRGNIAIGYSPRTQALVGYSPNLGPVIPPRGRSVSRDRRASEQLSPLPHPLAAPPLKSHPTNTPGGRLSTGSEVSTANTYFSGISLGVSSTHGDNDGEDDGFSEVVIIDGTGGHHGLAYREQESGRRMSKATGYTESLYMESESASGSYTGMPTPKIGRFQAA